MFRIRARFLCQPQQWKIPRHLRLFSPKKITPLTIHYWWLKRSFKIWLIFPFRCLKEITVYLFSFFRKGHLSTNSISVASFRLHRGINTFKGVQGSARSKKPSISHGPLQAFCRSLVRDCTEESQMPTCCSTILKWFQHWVSGGDAWLRLQDLRQLSNAASTSERSSKSQRVLLRVPEGGLTSRTRERRSIQSTSN